MAFSALFGVVASSLLAAGGSSLPTPTRITMDFHDAPVSDILDDLQRQAGYLHVDLGRRNTPTSDLNATRTADVRLDGVPLFDAIDEIERACGLLLTADRDLDSQSLADHPLVEQPVADLGGMRIEPFLLEVQSHRRQNLLQPNVKFELAASTLHLRGLVDPRLVLAREATFEVKSVTNAAGESLLGPASDGRDLKVRPVRVSGRSIDLDIPLRLSDDDDVEALSLEAELVVGLAVPDRLIRTADPHENATTAAGWQIKPLTPYEPAQMRAAVQVPEGVDAGARAKARFFVRYENGTIIEGSLLEPRPSTELTELTVNFHRAATLTPLDGPPFRETFLHDPVELWMALPDAYEAVTLRVRLDGVKLPKSQASASASVAPAAP